MRSSRYIQIIMASLALVSWSCSKNQFSQTQPETDPLYFASTDREKVLYEVSGNNSKDYTSQNKFKNTDNYTAKDVNPEYINSYAEQSRQEVQQDQNGEYNNDVYYDQELADSKRDNYSNNNNYSSNYNNYGYGSNYSYGSYGPYSSFGYPAYGTSFYGPYGHYDPFWGPSWGQSFYSPRSSFWMSFSFGSAWGSPYNSWYRNYDPFWGGYGYPYGAGFGGYNMGFYDGYYSGRNRSYYYDRGNNVTTRTVYRGPRNSRSSGMMNRYGGQPRQRVATGTNGQNNVGNNSGSQRVENRYTQKRGNINRGGSSQTSVSTPSSNTARSSYTDNNVRRSSYNRNTEVNGSADRFNSRPTAPASRPRTSNRSSEFNNRSSNPSYNRNSNWNSNSNSSSAPTRSSGYSTPEYRTSSPGSSGSNSRSSGTSGSSRGSSSSSGSSGSSGTRRGSINR